ncbi:LysR substrate-binding domain-containing protein [Pseudomonas sp. MYb330]|uniref:LysR substrate-binding domain-containing protein n=1 Tax=Pseudomonas sp. MYb330 TaxID=2745233 RepID=UPI00403F19E0
MHKPFDANRYQLNGRTLPIVFENGETLVPRGRIGLDSGFGLRAAALGGMGIAYLMQCTVQQDLDSGALQQVLAEQRLPSLAIHSLHAFGALTPIRIKLFADFVQQELLRMGGRQTLSHTITSNQSSIDITHPSPAKPSIQRFTLVHLNQTRYKRHQVVRQHNKDTRPLSRWCI